MEDRDATAGSKGLEHCSKEISSFCLVVVSIEEALQNGKGTPMEVG